MSLTYFPKEKRSTLYLDDLFWGIVRSSHILHKHGIVDAYGHISSRNPDTNDTFFMPCNMPPALLSSADDIVEYKIENAEPVEGDKAKPGYVERYIHSEIYKQFPNITSVLHSHCTEILPYTVNGVPFHPLIHTAGFLGPKQPPVWDIAKSYSSSDSPKDLLVRTQALGKALSTQFTHSTTSNFFMSTMHSALPSQIAPNAPDGPDHAVVLMRGHGFTTVGESLEAVVFQAIYSKENAKVLTQSLITQSSFATSEFGGRVEGTVQGQVDVEKKGKLVGGKLKDATVKDGKITQEGELTYLSDTEAKATRGFIDKTMSRPWALWVREVEVDPLYECKITKTHED